MVRVVIGVADHIHRRAGRVGGPFSDHVGHLFEPAAVDRQETEPGPQTTVLDDTWLIQQLGKRLRPSLFRNPGPRPMCWVPAVQEFDPAVRQAMMDSAVDNSLEVPGTWRTGFDAVID